VPSVETRCGLADPPVEPGDDQGVASHAMTGEASRVAAGRVVGSRTLVVNARFYPRMRSNVA